MADERLKDLERKGEWAQAAGVGIQNRQYPEVIRLLLGHRDQVLKVVGERYLAVLINGHIPIISGCAQNA